MILADNGSNFFIIGDTDPNWNDDDLGNLKTVTSANFDVLQMVPEYAGMDAISAPTHYPENRADDHYLYRNINQREPRDTRHLQLHRDRYKL